jgi:hypothetical protein
VEEAVGRVDGVEAEVGVSSSMSNAGGERNCGRHTKTFFDGTAVEVEVGAVEELGAEETGVRVSAAGRLRTGSRAFPPGALMGSAEVEEAARL